MTKTDQNERLIDAIDKLAFIIDTSKNNSNYSQILTNIIVELKEIGNGYKNDGCLKKIYHELRTLNKTIIMAALLTSAIKKPEQTLQKYHKIIEQYLN